MKKRKEKNGMKKWRVKKMKWMGLLELKKLFVDFFKMKEHLYLESFPLIPKGDNSLLFINSGMAPMKKWFLGQETPPKKRVVTVQKCIRTGDLKRVGITDRHGTFFEMLGNFSFGDYFKRQAIFWAYEFVVDVLKMPKEKLYVTVYEEDDEAYSIWEKEVLVPKDHIVRLGKEDNFWEIGSGPCGPCSELYFDRGEEHGCGKASCSVGCECDRYIEFWNLVFSQYDNKGNGQYEDLKQKNIDTGMGLERLACIFQGVDNLFEVDTVKKILEKVCDMAGVEYKKGKEKDVLIRIITDHIRSISYLICDGVIPSNEGRGYVLRRLIRRAHKSGKKLDIKGNFLMDLAKVVVEIDPQLEGKYQYIKEVLLNEEEAFEKILKASEEKALELIKEVKNKAIKGFEKADEAGEVFLKSNAEILALEEEISGFFNIFKIELERFFSVVEEKEIDELYRGYFRSLEDLIKLKLFRYLDMLKDLVEIFDDNLNDIFFAEEAGEEILKFVAFENVKNLDKNDLSAEKEKIKSVFKNCKKKVERVLDFLKEKFNGYVDENISDEDVVLKLKKVFKHDVDEDVVLKKPTISAEKAFKLCDTYGMPYDILKDMADENGVLIDEEGFLNLMEEQKKRAKAAASFKDSGWEEKESEFLNFAETEFRGYNELKIKTKVLGVFKEEEYLLVVLEKTTIYPVGGGQVHDDGKILSVDTEEILGEILDCKKLATGQIIHKVKALKEIEKDMEVIVLVDENKREKIKKNHTAAHLLQKALILNLGEHIRQAGQLVDEKRLRFDFLHFKPLDKNDLKIVEDTVNTIILKGLDVNILEMDKEKAKQEGAIALFDEKYKDIVRVVDIAPFSKEFCGGTHVKNTKEIGVFKIISESSVGSGVRRIEAITSFEVLNMLKDLEERYFKIEQIFKVKTKDELEEKAKNCVSELKEKSQELKSLKLKFKKQEFLKELEEKGQNVNGLKVLVFCEDSLDSKELRLFSDCLKNEEENLVCLIFVSSNEKFNLLVVCGKEAVKKGLDAGAIVKKLAVLANGKGGGKKDFAMAGVENFNNKKEIEEEFFKILNQI